MNAAVSRDVAAVPMTKYSSEPSRNSLSDGALSRPRAWLVQNPAVHRHATCPDGDSIIRRRPVSAARAGSCPIGQRPSPFRSVPAKARRLIRLIRPLR
jgi:hypothetical protein